VFALALSGEILFCDSFWLVVLGADWQPHKGRAKLAMSIITTTEAKQRPSILERERE
jgi:hypothetical protein